MERLGEALGVAEPTGAVGVPDALGDEDDGEGAGEVIGLQLALATALTVSVWLPARIRDWLWWVGV